MMLEGQTLVRREPAGLRTVQMAKEIAFPIIGHSVAKNKVLHPATDINGVQLDETMVGERRRKVRRRPIQEKRAAMKAPGIQRRELKRVRHDSDVKGTRGRFSKRSCRSSISCRTFVAVRRTSGSGSCRRFQSARER